MNDQQPLFPKEKFDACMKQADFYLQRLFNRQGYQWKITLGLWTVLIASTGYFVEHPNGVLCSVQKPYAWGVLFVYGLVWVRAIAYRNHLDGRAAHHFRSEAERYLLDSGHSFAELPTEKWIVRWLRWCFGFVVNWAHFFEVLVTAIIIYCAVRLVCPGP